MRTRCCRRCTGREWTKPSALFPDLPTVAASGVPGYECDSMIGAFAPAKVSPTIINRLSKEMAMAVNKPEIKQRFAASGVDTVGSSPEQWLPP